MNNFKRVEINYVKLIKESLELFYKNPNLFLPILIGIGLFILFLILLSIQFGFFFSIASFNLSTPESLLTSNNYSIILIILLIIDLLILFFGFAYLKAIIFGLYKQIIEKNEIDIHETWALGRKYAIPYFKLGVVYFIIFGIPILISLLLFYFSYINILSLFIPIIITILFLVYSFLMAVSLIFSSTMLILENLSIRKIIKKSFKLVRLEKVHFFMTWLIVILITSIVIISLSILQTIPVIGTIFSYLGIFISIIIGLWRGLFIFKSYLALK